MMIPAAFPERRPAGARLLVVDRRGHLRHVQRQALIDVLQAGDLVVANDAATIPSSLVGKHVPSGRHVEVRLAGSDSVDPRSLGAFTAVLFGLGDFRMRTEDRPDPPAVSAGDRLRLGSLSATVTARIDNHPRLVRIEFAGSPAQIWEGIARHGRSVQYSHLQLPLAMWDTWTAIAGAPVAFEPPSAGFVLDWRLLAAMRNKGVAFATLTHAAGLSSTGDVLLDSLLPFDEAYRISYGTAVSIERARLQRRRIIAVGTTVVRALEHAAARDGSVRAGDGLATGRIGPTTALQVVDAILSGTHERGSSHFELLRAFAHDETLAEMSAELEAHAYRTHEFGDSIFVERSVAAIGVRQLRERRHVVLC